MPEKVPAMNFYLGCHNQLVVDNTVWCIPVCFDLVSKQIGIHSINRSLASQKSNKEQVMSFYLGCHDQLVVDNIVWCVSHTEQCTGRVKMTRHSSSHVHVFSNALQVQKENDNCRNNTLSYCMLQGPGKVGEFKKGRHLRGESTIPLVDWRKIIVLYSTHFEVHWIFL